MSNTTEKSTITPYKRFWRLLNQDKKEIRNIYVYAIFNGLINLSLPLGIQAIINLIQGGYISTSWIMLVIFVVMGVAFAGIMQIYQLRITENLQQKLFSRAAFEFAYRIPRIKIESLFNKYLPELTNRFFDIISVQKGLSKILIDFSTAALQLFFGLLLLSLYHPFFIVFSLVMFVLVVLLFILNARVGLETSIEESKNKYKLVDWLENLAANFLSFKLAGKTKLPMERTDCHTENYLKAREQHFKILVRLYSFLVLFKVLVTTGLLVLGGFLVMEQQMNIGQFVAAEIIIIMVMNSVEKMTLSLDTVFDVLTALEKIADVTELELEGESNFEDVESFEKQGLSIDIQQLDFQYPGKISKTLKEIQLSISSNEKVVITGAVGSGKTTLLHLLSGVYELQSGQFAINGLPKENWKKGTLRNYIGDHFEDQQFINGTVHENISLGREKADYKSVEWAVKAVGLENFIQQLPEGLDTNLQPRNNNLPQSEMQKLFLARTIVDRPSLLLVEDTFDALSPDDKRQIIDFLMRDDQPWTLVVVTDDRYWTEAADQIVLLDHGSIKKKGSYASMKNDLKLKDYSYA